MTTTVERSEVVLVIDDDEDCRDLAKLVLRRAGFRVLCIADGERAFEALRGLRPDAVVLDLQMPRISGAEIDEWLRHSDDHDDLVVVFWTASGARAAVDGRPVVQKGGTLAPLVETLRAELARARTRGGG